MSYLRRLLDCRAGNVAMTFAIAVVPLLLAAGAAIDMIRASNARSALQAAADAAALAGGASSAPTEAEVEAIAAQYLEANGASSAVKSIKVASITTDPDTGALKVKLSGLMQTSFLAVAGLSTLDVGVESEVMRGSSGPLELVLALDTTHSMSENDKIGTLRTAASNLVKNIMKGENVKVGVVPFADYQQLGMAYSGKSWLNVPPTESGTYDSCDTTYPDKTGCSMQTSTCYADGVPYSCTQEVCSSWGEPQYSNCKKVSYVYKFEGCVKSRPKTYHDSIASPDSPKYPGVTWKCNVDIRDLTSEQAQVLDTINSMWTGGNTYIPSGLIWAWNMLTPDEPLTAAQSKADVESKGGKKVVVLMTDGVNTMVPEETDGWFGNPGDLGYGAGPDYANGITSSLCSKIKDEGIILYTVLFDVDDADTQEMLRDCASDPTRSFVADDAAELIAAFADIGVSLTRLRLVK